MLTLPVSPRLSAVAMPNVDERIGVVPPYQVLLLNDDVHTVHFVIHLLMTIFGHDVETATRITLAVHEQGQGRATTCSKERAELYLEQIAGMPEGDKGPIQAVMEPV